MKIRHFNWICIMAFILLSAQAVRADGRVLIMVPHEEQMIKVGLDIGNSKISCIVCDINKNSSKKILAFVNHPTKNLKKNSIINYDLAKNEISELIKSASKDSQTDSNSLALFK